MEKQFNNVNSKQDRLVDDDILIAAIKQVRTSKRKDVIVMGSIQAAGAIDVIFLGILLPMF